MHRNHSQHITKTIHIYTTGLGEEYVCHRWNNIIYPYIQTLPYDFNIVHYDKEFWVEPEEGELIRKYLTVRDIGKFNKPFILFNFAGNGLPLNYYREDYEKLYNLDSENAIVYIPYCGNKKWDMFYGKLQPFKICDGKIITYIDDIINGNYQIVNKEHKFKSNEVKDSNNRKLKYMTVKLHDKELELDTLANIIFSINEGRNEIFGTLLKSLDPKSAYDRYAKITKIGAHFPYSDELNQLSHIDVQ